MNKIVLFPIINNLKRAIQGIEEMEYNMHRPNGYYYNIRTDVSQLDSATKMLRGKLDYYHLETTLQTMVCAKLDDVLIKMIKMDKSKTKRKTFNAMQALTLSKLWSALEAAVEKAKMEEDENNIVTVLDVQIDILLAQMSEQRAIACKANDLVAELTVERDAVWNKRIRAAAWADVLETHEKQKKARSSMA